MNERLRAFRTLPLRDRERALDIAKVFGELFDEMAEALQTRQWHPDLLEEVVGMKPMLMEALEQGAEATYTVAVQKQALYIMERHPGAITAEATVTMVDSTILEAAVGSDT